APTPPQASPSTAARACASSTTLGAVKPRRSTGSGPTTTASPLVPAQLAKRLALQAGRAHRPHQLVDQPMLQVGMRALGAAPAPIHGLQEGDGPQLLRRIKGRHRDDFYLARLAVDERADHALIIALASQRASARPVDGGNGGSGPVPEIPAVGFNR